jgi:serine/threonine protein kinase
VRPERGDVLCQLVYSGRPTTKFQPPAAPGSWAELERLAYPVAVARLGAQLAAGLAHAHERGVRHGALKPSNVLLADDGIPMLFDFPLTEDESRHGAPDFGADIYALGLLLHELLTGDLPIPDGPGGLPTGGDRDPLLPKGLAPIVRRCLADPAGRYPTARELERDLERFAEGRTLWQWVRGWAGGP